MQKVPLLSFPKNALTMATAIFCYEKLDARNREIRVCVLQPGNLSDAISCVLRTVSLNEDPCYEALSYVWGDPSLTKQINANGSTIATTESLHTALRYLRWDSVPRVIWADALCINQLDIDERSSQVGMMGDIYRQALEVQIWFGEVEEMAPDKANSPDENLVSEDHAKNFKCFLQSKDLMTNLSSLSSAAWHPTGANVPGALDILRLLEEDKHLYQMPFFKITSAAEIELATVWYDALRTLSVMLTRPWWTRVWIVQEAVLPPKAMVHIGNIELPLSNFRAAAQNLNKHRINCCSSWDDLWHGYYDIWVPLNGPSQYVVQLDEMMERKAAVTIGQAFQLSQTRDASDPRDHVYALDALIKPNNRGFTTPNYNMSTAEVFENATLGLVASMGTLGVLIYAQGVKDDNMFELPSWVCNWSHEYYMGLELYIGNAPNGHRFEFQSTDRESGSLDLWGLEVDSISAVGSNFEDSGSVHELISQVEEWQELKGPRTADTAHALLRAVLLDITHHLPEERRLLPEDLHFIEDWWHWIESLGMQTNATDVPRTFPTKEIRNYHVAFTHNAVNGSIFASSQGLLGMGLRTIRQGDRIFVVKGSSAPLILRPKCNKDDSGDPATHNPPDGYLLVGRCYLEGIMDGEVVTPDTDWQHLRLY